MTAVEWKVGNRFRVGDAEFTVTYVEPLSDYVDIRWDNTERQNIMSSSILAEMGAVKLTLVPPTIGVPQSVKDSPPPMGEFVLAWIDGDRTDPAGHWGSHSAKYGASVDWWMPQPAAPPEVTA